MLRERKKNNQAWIFISLLSYRIRCVPFSAYVVTASFDRVRAFDIDGENARKTAAREQLNKEDIEGQEKVREKDE